MRKKRSQRAPFVPPKACASRALRFVLLLLSLSLGEKASGAEKAQPEPVSPPCNGWAHECERPWWEYWQEQRARWFVSGKVGVGGYQQARSIIGYGKPFWMLGGLEIQGGTTGEFAAFAVGPRFELLAVNVSASLRKTHAYSRVRPEQSESYSALENTKGSRNLNRYSSLDGWLWGYIPGGPALGYWELGGIYLLRDPGQYATFEEFYRYTINQRTAMMARSVVWWRLLNSSLLIGPAGDVVLSPQRPALVRLGASVAFRLTRHLDSQLLLTIPVKSPDRYDWVTQSWGTLSLSYSLATGEPRPGF